LLAKIGEAIQYFLNASVLKQRMYHMT
jgi:hypothetical protein